MIFIDPTIVKNMTNTNQMSYPSLKFKKYTSFGFDYPDIFTLECVSGIDQYGNFKQTLVPDTVDTPISRIWDNQEISVNFIDPKTREPRNIAIGNNVNDPGIERDLIEKTNKMLTDGVVDERKEKIRLRLIKKLRNKSKPKQINNFI